MSQETRFEQPANANDEKSVERTSLPTREQWLLAERKWLGKAKRTDLAVHVLREGDHYALCFSRENRDGNLSYRSSYYLSRAAFMMLCDAIRSLPEIVKGFV